MIQEISPHLYHCEFRPDAVPNEKSFLLSYTADSILLQKISSKTADISPKIQNGRDKNPFDTKTAFTYTFPRLFDIYPDIEKTDHGLYIAKSLPEKETDAEARISYLFAIDENEYYCAEPPKELPDGYIFEKQRIFRTFSPQYQAFAGVTGSQLWRFMQSHRYCGRCGFPTVLSDTERALVCPKCGQIEYPKISPAVIVAVYDHNRLLMTKNTRSSYPYYALVAGFIEIGETPEDTVRREVLEEVGLHVKNIRAYKIQPWSFSDTLMLGFTAELDGSDIITLQESELTQACWFDREDIPVPPWHMSIGHEMINGFKNGTLNL